MDRRLTVDVPEEAYKEMLKMQYEKKMQGEKSSLREMIKTAVLEWLEKQSAKPINQ